MEEFDKWNEIKKETQKINTKVTIKPREIWWVKIGYNVGSEEYGKDKYFTRPVIVVKQLSSDLFVGIPTTTAIKQDCDYYHNIKYIDRKKKSINSYAMINQLRTFSKKRVGSKIGIINKNDFEKIQQKMLKVLFPSTKPRT